MQLDKHIVFKLRDFGKYQFDKWDPVFAELAYYFGGMFFFSFFLLFFFLPDHVNTAKFDPRSDEHERKPV